MHAYLNKVVTCVAARGVVATDHCLFAEDRKPRSCRSLEFYLVQYVQPMLRYLLDARHDFQQHVKGLWSTEAQHGDGAASRHGGWGDDGIAGRVCRHRSILAGSTPYTRTVGCRLYDALLHCPQARATRQDGRLHPPLQPSNPSGIPGSCSQ